MAVGTALGLLAGADAGLRLYVRGHTSATRFIDNKDSKFVHYRLQPGEKPLDAVFIGSSLTKNHVSTGVFHERGWEIYNMGISGRLLGDFPSMAVQAMARHPRVVVLDVSEADLVDAPHTEFTHWDDLLAEWRAGLPAPALARSLGNYLLDRHLLHYYREPLYEAAVAAVRRLAPAPAVVTARHADRTPAYADQVSRSPDCDVFKRTAYDNMVVLTCTNGDGIQLGRYDPDLDPLPHEPTGRALDDGAIRLLREVVHGIEGQAKPVVVLQPTWEKTPDIDLKDVERRIGAPVVDLRESRFTSADWCDGGHFNLYGRRKYSEALEAALAPYLHGG